MDENGLPITGAGVNYAAVSTNLVHFVSSGFKIEN
jgi:hypothetical protein